MYTLAVQLYKQALTGQYEKHKEYIESITTVAITPITLTALATTGV